LAIRTFDFINLRKKVLDGIKIDRTIFLKKSSEVQVNHFDNKKT